MTTLKYLYLRIFRHHDLKNLTLTEQGVEAMQLVSRLMAEHDIDWWLEFGTLLGMYRDNDFIRNDIDLDFGARLSDAPTITEMLTAAGCTLKREYHVVGELGMEQTFVAPNGVPFDIFYFFDRDNLMISNGFKRYKTAKRHSPRFLRVHEFRFEPFETTAATFKGVEVRIPANTERHIVEVYGPGYKVYDPNFKDGFNKVKFPITQKVGVGFKRGLAHLKEK